MRNCKCGNSVANNAKFCPKCGNRFTGSFTKLLAGFLIFTAMVAVIAIVSAESGSGVPPSSPVAAAPTPPVKPRPKSAVQMIAARKTYAQVIDQQLLDMGIESKTYTAGADAKTLVIEDVLAGRVRQNAIQQNDALFQNLRDLGFTRLKYTNGYTDDLGYGVEWTIKP